MDLKRMIRLYVCLQDLMRIWDKLREVAVHGVRIAFTKFMRSFQDEKFQTLEDLYRFNETNHHIELPPGMLTHIHALE